MFKQRSRRGGFTLPEVLVTVAIVAVLAAMVVPAVTQQISKGDAPAIKGSINGLQTAFTSFVSDVRKLPGEISQLQNPLVAGTDKDLGTTAINGTAYTGPIASRWKGPYESSGNASGQVPMGLGWSTADTLYKTAAPAYVVVSLFKSGAVVTDAEDLDLLVDGVVNANAGLIRWVPGTPVTDLSPAGTVRLYLMSAAQ